MPYSNVKYLGFGEGWWGEQDEYPVRFLVFRSSSPKNPYLLVDPGALVEAVEV